jgi:MFS family permease
MLATIRQRNFALLWFAGLISLAGDWMLLIALPIYIYQLTGSAVAVSIMFIAKRAPSVLFGSLAGVFVDRWDRRRTMLVANLLLALALLPLLAVRSAEQVWIVYLVALLESTFIQFFSPAENALLPQLVGEEYIVPANALNSLNNNIARLIGPALGGLAAVTLGLGGVALLDAASFLIAALLVWLIRGNYRATPAADAPATPLGAWRTLGREWLAGLRVIAGSRPVAMLFALVAITSLGEGVFGVMFVLFVNTVLGGGAQEIGSFMSAQAVGGLLGALLVGRLGGGRPALLIGIAGVLFGLIDLAIFNYPSFFPGFLPIVLLFVLVGIPGVALFTGMNALLQLAVADEYRGRVFGTYGTTGALLAIVGTVLAGALGDRVPVVTVLNIQGLAYVLAGLAVLVLLGGRAIAGHEAAPAQAAS